MQDRLPKENIDTRPGRSQVQPRSWMPIKDQLNNSIFSTAVVLHCSGTICECRCELTSIPLGRLKPLRRSTWVLGRHNRPFVLRTFPVVLNALIEEHMPGPAEKEAHSTKDSGAHIRGFSQLPSEHVRCLAHTGLLADSNLCEL